MHLEEVTDGSPPHPRGLSVTRGGVSGLRALRSGILATGELDELYNANNRRLEGII